MNMLYTSTNPFTSNLTKLATAVLFGALFVFVTFKVIDTAASHPDVHFSYSTQECVKVVNYTDELFTCDNLPKRFYHVWVQ